MSNNIVNSFAERSGKTVEEVEIMWKAIEKSVKKSHPELTKKDKSYYKLIVGSLKISLHLEGKMFISKKFLEEQQNLEEGIID